ncbi:MAG: ndk [Ignavibacteria bacterium]|nr:ndk [Ignavibacteria bacterium]
MSKTLAIIKPDAVEKNAAGAIIEKIQSAGFKILGLRMLKIDRSQAGVFYEVHKERPFYNDLCDYMSGGKIIPIALEKDNAVDDFRKVIGNTDPEQAEVGTIRKLFGTSKAVNAIHGSDSDENAAKEIVFFFNASELV